ncbi:large ribosomal subunit protein uL4m-like [Lytechinus pictus]|uniref:large ribosomal subunit protein uL4m-like n=1 Tax=Lytechinus pictus TaxID=7653 RepID=UPI0030B9D607
MFTVLPRITSLSTRAFSCLTTYGNKTFVKSVSRSGALSSCWSSWSLNASWLIKFNQKNGNTERYYSSDEASGLPLVTSRELLHSDPTLEPVQAWLETMNSLEDNKLGLIDLHPHVFATFPRIDILHRNVLWQRNYKRISLANAKSRAEVRGGGRKPWRQKGTGRARHGSRRSPIWVGGGKALGPRGPRSYWYVLPNEIRAHGLRVALTVKLTQDDLHIVDSLDIPSSDPGYLQDLCKERYWGESVLFVDV